ncbi:RNA polymerase factor sigma-54 [Psychrobacter jeotgali]|uniref:RNA polymerase factor sigma-54 n=1 Tax=Psychrobacter jeotgali TaxID=179010 RepID=UPI0019196E30|nr:RNA polymerase factor sigma-54 [Psychrobacter jeotgali]
MSMSFGLATTLTTSQKLTPQMQQAIKLLQLSSLELAQEVQAKLDSNPLLERVEEDEVEMSNDEQLGLDTAEALTLEMWNSGTAHETSETESDDYHDYDTTVSDSLDKLTQAGIDDSAIDNHALEDSVNLDDSFGISNFDNSHFDTGNYTSKTSSKATSTDYEEFDSYQGTTHSSIQDYVRWQMNFKHLSDTDMLIADYLIESMDDRGFIQLDINELLQSFNTMASFYQWDNQIERNEIKAVLRIIQSCDPLGVGAANLSECLALQLAKLDSTIEYFQQAKKLLSASEYLVSNNIKKLTDVTGLSAADIAPALQLLRTLDPAPGQSFQSKQPNHNQLPESYDIPDVLVSPAPHDEESWQVRLNPETLPKLRVNQEYANLVKRGDDSPDNQYLRENLTDARLFIRSIEERNYNLLKVATSIIRRQQDFLLHGATAMQPLILKDIAEEVGLHESTVSRLTTSKTILTPQGLFSLKHFFSSHVSSNEGDISSTAISAMIKQLIVNEDPKKPLSDSRIQAYLGEEGIDIARRTVAKYREAMNIVSSTQRKQKY